MHKANEMCVIFLLKTFSRRKDYDGMNLIFPGKQTGKFL